MKGDVLFEVGAGRNILRGGKWGLGRKEKGIPCQPPRMREVLGWNLVPKSETQGFDSWLTYHTH